MWRYTDETSGAGHLGPMAQAFYALFHLGLNDTTIGTLDESGIALAAIQGLNQLVKEKTAQIDAQRREIEDLRERVSQVETLRSEMDGVKRALSQLTEADGRIAMQATP